MKRSRLIGALLVVAGCAKAPAPATGSGALTDASRAGDADAALAVTSADFVVSPRTWPLAVNVQLVFSDAGEALAYYADDVGFHVRRYRRGAWEAALDNPAGVDFLAAALSPDGTARFAWAGDWQAGSRGIAVSMDLHDILTVALGADDVWSEPVRVGDTGIGWWQEPTAPAPVVAIDETGLSIAAWSRLGQETSGPAITWASVVAPGAPPAPAQSIDLPAATQAGRPSIAMRGAGKGMVAWSTFDGTTRWMLMANLSGGAWGSPIALDQAVGDVRFGSQNALVVTGDLSGTASVAYLRSDTQGSQVIARHSSDGSNWSAPETTGVVSGLYSSQMVGNRNGQVMTTWTDGSYRSGLPLTVRFHSRENGWSAPTAVDGASAAKAALAADGRAALVYSPQADSSVIGVASSSPMALRRYAPATGWGAPEIFHDEGGSVTGLGFAGNDLIVAWVGASGEGLVKVLKEP